MIANATPVYLDPKTGRVYGTPTPAVADQATASTRTGAELAAERRPLAAQQGDTSTSKESGSTTGSDTTAGTADGATGDTKADSKAGTANDTTADAGKTAGASASGGASSTADVESDPNQLQAPATR